MFHAAVNLWSAESDICQKQRKWRWTTVGSALCGSATVPTRSVQAASSSAEVSYVGLGRVSVPRPTTVYQVIRLDTRRRDAQDIALRSWETRRQPWCLVQPRAVADSPLCGLRRAALMNSSGSKPSA